MRDHYDALIVGAGHGGANAALALRQRKFTGSIALVSDESSLPYERPPLSKDYLSGKRGFEQILLRSLPVWESHGIDLLLGERAVEVNAQAHALTLESRRTLTYGNLVWAAGDGRDGFPVPAMIWRVFMRSEPEKMLIASGRKSDPRRESPSSGRVTSASKLPRVSPRWASRCA